MIKNAYVHGIFLGPGFFCVSRWNQQALPSRVVVSTPWNKSAATNVTRGTIS
jgi:hypothetical protein